MTEHLNDSPPLFHFSPLLILSNIFLVCFASCLALKLSIPLVIPQAALGKPATTLRAPPPFWDLLLLVVVLRLFDDAFFLLDALGMLVLNEDSNDLLMILLRFS